MKKTNHSKLTLDLTTLRPLREREMTVTGAELGISVGTCTACLPTFNPTCQFSCRGTCA
jgi:hypothetical protein